MNSCDFFLLSWNEEKGLAGGQSLSMKVKYVETNVLIAIHYEIYSLASHHVIQPFLITFSLPILPHEGVGGFRIMGSMKTCVPKEA